MWALLKFRVRQGPGGGSKEVLPTVILESLCGHRLGLVACICQISSSSLRRLYEDQVSEWLSLFLRSLLHLLPQPQTQSPFLSLLQDLGMPFPHTGMGAVTTFHSTQS